MRACVRVLLRCLGSCCQRRICLASALALRLRSQHAEHASGVQICRQENHLTLTLANDERAHDIYDVFLELYCSGTQYKSLNLAVPTNATVDDPDAALLLSLANAITVQGGFLCPAVCALAGNVKALCTTSAGQGVDFVSAFPCLESVFVYGPGAWLTPLRVQRTCVQLARCSRLATIVVLEHGLSGQFAESVQGFIVSTTTARHVCFNMHIK